MRASVEIVFERPIQALVVVLALLLAGGTASADPLTFYTDESAWLAAVSGYNVGPYPFETIVTQHQRTYQWNSHCGYGGISESTSTESEEGFNSLFASFSYDYCLYPRAQTADTEVVMNFSVPIFGFSTNNFGVVDGGNVGFTLNGQTLPGRAAGYYDGFFGVVGPIYSLDFLCGCSSSIPTDDFERFYFQDPIAAMIDEPSGLASFAVALSLLALVRTAWKR
ncbi:MAG: hypothetical protein ACREFK_11335 [Stellaceae bacterium]